MERGRGRGKKRRGGDRGGSQQQQQQQQQQQPMGRAPGGPMGAMGSPMGGFPHPMMQQAAMGMMPMMGGGMGGGMGFMGGQGQMQPHPGFAMGPMPPHMGSMPFADQPHMRPPMGAPGGLPFAASGSGGGGGPGAMGPPRPPAQAAPGPPRPPQEAPSNDYCQHFVNTGLRPQNFLRDSVLEDRYEDYPQLQRLVEAKVKQVRDSYTPPYGLRADLRKLKLSKDTFGCRFDVILIDPPWEEYARRAPSMVEDNEVWTWEQIMELDISGIADSPCFVFLWCGGGAEGLEAGRHCMRRWNFRRSEDICWIKTNKEHPSRKYLSNLNQDSKSVLVRTKEHCLMGIRGNVKRHLDGHIIHANMDTDVIVSEEPQLGSTEKPEELYDIIERFCNGKRRLELFGRDNNMRPGWVTVGKDITHSNFKPSAYVQHFRNQDGSLYTENKMGVPRDAPTLVRTTDIIEELRPKSPGRR